MVLGVTMSGKPDDVVVESQANAFDTSAVEPILDNLTTSEGSLRFASLRALLALPIPSEVWPSLVERLEAVLSPGVPLDPSLPANLARVPNTHVEERIDIVLAAVRDPERRRSLIQARNQAEESVTVWEIPRHDFTMLEWGRPDAWQIDEWGGSSTEHARTVVENLWPTFPIEPYDPDRFVQAVASLPIAEANSVVTTLWRQLAENRDAYERLGDVSPQESRLGAESIIAGGNALVELTYGMGEAFSPDVTSLFNCYLRLGDRYDIRDQLAWTVGRAGYGEILAGLRPYLTAGDDTIRLAATELMADATVRVGQEPPIHGAAPFVVTPALYQPDLSFGDFDGDEVALPASANGGEPPPLAEAEPPGDPDVPDDPPRSAYPRIDCDDVVEAGQEFELQVGIAKSQDPDVEGPEIVRPVWSVGPYVLTVQIIANGFKLKKGESFRHELAVSERQPYPFVTLHLTPKAQRKNVRARAIQVSYFVGSQPVGVAYRPVVVVRKPELRASAPKAKTARRPIVTIPPDYTEPDLTIQIATGDREGALLWSFESPHVETPKRLIPTKLRSDPQKFTQQLINQLNQPADVGLAILMRGLAEQITQAMPRTARDLVRAIAPLVDGRPPTVLIQSQDPHIPWELALFDPPIDRAKAEFFGAQATVGRWILPDPEQEKPELPPREKRTVDSMAVLCGRYPEDEDRWKRLECAEDEAKKLAKLYKASSVTTDYKSVIAFLEGPPTAEVIHFVGHGIYDPESVENGLVLDDLTFLTPHHVFGARLSGPSPFVFLNACQAGGGYNVLGSCGGLVGAFLVAGATGVVAPVWSVDDASARDISLEFYRRALSDGAQPAEILRSQRARFGKDEAGKDTPPEDATVLAYQFFGHPNMRLIRA